MQQSNELIPIEIVNKRYREPNQVFYEVVYNRKSGLNRQKWMNLLDLADYLHLVQDYEVKVHNYSIPSDPTMQFVELIKDQTTDHEILYRKATSDLKCDQISSQQEAPQSKQFSYLYDNRLKTPDEEQLDLTKQLKKITKQYNKFSSGPIYENKKGFEETDILKIITYIRDELDGNKFNFLVQWKQRDQQRPLLPSWVSHDKMKAQAPNTLKEYAKLKNITII